MKRRKFDKKEERWSTTTTTESHDQQHLLCRDAIFEILTRLPVKSLIRFTCVSRSWYSLIRNPNFIAAHNNNKKKKLHRYLLHFPDCHRPTLSPFVTTFTNKWQSESEESSSSSNNNNNSKLIKLKLPFDEHYQVIGSAEGLVCIVNFKSQVYLCNPLLQIFKKVPPSPSELTNPRRYSFKIDGENNVQLGLGYYSPQNNVQLGLGYSPQNNDYRIVKIIYTSFCEVICCSSKNKVEIYSLRSNSWKTIDGDCATPAMVYPGGSSVYNNGCIKWVAVPPTQPRRFANMSFDMDKESWSLMEFPTLLRFLPNRQYPPLADVKDVLRYYVNTLTTSTPAQTKQEELIYCSRSSNSNGGPSDSLWKVKTLSCENSWVRLEWVDQWGRRKLTDATSFDGMMTLVMTDCQNLMNFLGFNVDTREPWEKEDLITESHIVSMSESLVLLDHIHPRM